MTPYLSELRDNWRPVAAAFVGMGAGLMTASYVMGIQAPYLIAEFGWERSQFALITALGLISILSFPIVGRLADVIGVRKIASIGAIAAPLLFLALSQLQDLRTYVILFTLQCLILVTTTPPIYCRVVVQYIKHARGLALALVTSGPALIVAVGGPLLNNLIAAQGWRAGYLALVVFTAVAGVLAIMLLPPTPKTTTVQVKRRTAKEDYARLLRTPAFWIIMSAVMLVSFPQSMMMTQLSLVLVENGVSGVGASAIISLFATGTLVGRFVAGVALDRFPAPIVSAVGVLLSAVGLFIFASDLDSRLMLMLAALLFGLTYGAEGDVVAYLVVRNFGVKIYSSVAGIMASVVAISATVCAISLSVMLDAFGNFAPFLTMSGVMVVIGSVLFLLLPFNPVVSDEEGVDSRAHEAPQQAQPGEEKEAKQALA